MWQTWERKFEQDEEEEHRECGFAFLTGLRRVGCGKCTREGEDAR